jgi:MFS family permease
MDRFGRRFVGLLSLTLLTVSFILLWQFGLSSYAALIGIGMAFGVSNGSSAGVILTLGGDHAPPDCRAKFIGLYRAVTDLGELIGPLGSALLMGQFTLQIAALGSAVFCLVGAFWVYFTVAETLKKKGHKSVKHSEALGIVQLPLPDSSASNESNKSTEGSSAEKDCDDQEYDLRDAILAESAPDSAMDDSGAQV